MMAGVMYQGYASYLQAYQRHSNPYCPTTPLALNHYDKVITLRERPRSASGEGPATRRPTGPPSASGAAAPKKRGN